MTGRMLLITPHYAPQQGGVPRLITSIVESGGVETSVHWRVITTAASPNCETAADTASARVPVAVDVVRVNGTQALVRAALASRRWLQAPGARIVCGHPYLAPIAVLLGWWCQVPVVGLAYGRELVATRRKHRLALLFLRPMSKVITISERSAAATRSCGVAPHRAAIVHPILPPAWRDGERDRLNAGNLNRSGEINGLRLVMVSRLAEGYKNFETAIRAAGILGRLGVIESLTIIGDGPRRDALQSFAQESNSAAFVRFAGAIDDDEFTALLATMDIGIFPSRESIAEGGFEGFGLVVHELGAGGLPMIVGDVAGAKDAMVEDFCIALDPDDLRAWVNVISALGVDPDTRAAMAGRAERWGKTLDASVTARAYCKAIAA